MAKLTAKARKAIPAKNFALPGGRYPIEDASHARNALARASANASPSEQATIRRKVKAKYPGIQVASGKKAGGRLDRPTRCYQDGGRTSDDQREVHPADNVLVQGLRYLSGLYHEPTQQERATRDGVALPVAVNAVRGAAGGQVRRDIPYQPGSLGSTKEDENVKKGAPPERYQYPPPPKPRFGSSSA